MGFEQPSMSREDQIKAIQERLAQTEKEIQRVNTQYEDFGKMTGGNQWQMGMNAGDMVDALRREQQKLNQQLEELEGGKG